jgi:di/tricarboxylate transporter
MTTEAWIATATVAAVFVLLAATSVAPYLILVGAMALLLVTGVLAPESALAGFSNPGMITVGVLFVVSAGLDQTGVLTHLVHRVLDHPRSLLRAQARLILPVIAGSAFLNNTPLVAMLMPVVKDWSRRTGYPASQLLIPLSYAAILGGTCTLVGTSTNLVISGLLTETGRPALDLFDPAWVGLPSAFAGAVFLLVAGHRLLPHRETHSISGHDPREYSVEMVVESSGALVGKSIESSGLLAIPELALVDIYRNGQLHPILDTGERLCAGDQLVFVGVVESVIDLQKVPGLSIAGRHVFDIEASRADLCFAEAVVSRSSPLVGHVIHEGKFCHLFDATVIAVSRNGERIRGPLGDIDLRAGDAVLVEALPSFVEQHRNSSDFYLVSKLDDAVPLAREKAPLALAILAAMVVAAGTGILTMLQAALLAAGAMLASRCCSEQNALRSLDLRLLLAIAASFALGEALDRTGAAATIAGAMLSRAGDNPWLGLAVIYGVVAVATELITNNAAAVIALPIALATADALGVSHLPFVFAVMMAASASFATPLGYQTNLMVYGAGGYRFTDFLRIGVPMNVVMWIAAVILTPLFWPFTP